MLNNEHFLRELISEDASLVERLLGKLADLRESTSRVRDPEARAVIKEIRAIEETLLDAVAERGMVYRDRKLVMVDREREEEKDTAGAVKESRKGGKQRDSRITVNMTDEDRARILKDKTISPPVMSVDEMFDVSFEELERNRKSQVEKPMIEKLRELGCIKEYKADAIDISFDFTTAGLRKSMNSQVTHYGGNLGDLAKVVMNMQKLLDSAVLIEVHSDKKKADSQEQTRLKQIYVLLSAFQDGRTITPVQFEIKQFANNDNRLYLAVALTKIETGVMGDTALHGEERTRLLPVSNISIPQIIRKINPQDENFFKYIPDEFLDDAQRMAKQRATAKDIAKYEKKNVKYSRKPIDSNNPGEKRLQTIREHMALADALAETVESEQEFRAVQAYKAKAVELTNAAERIAELRKKTAEVNREINSWKEKKKRVDQEGRPAVEAEESAQWAQNGLNEAIARKQAYLDEMNQLDEMIQKETSKLLSLRAAKPLQNALREANKRADAMERSAERARERELETKEWAKKAIKENREESQEWAIKTVKENNERAKEKVKETKEWVKYSEKYSDLANYIAKAASDLFLWKNEVFFNHTGISDVDLFRRTLGKLTTERYRGHFNQKGARKCIGAYGEWYLSDEAKRILGDGEDWGVYSAEIAEKIQTVANGTKPLTVDDLQDILDIMNNAKRVSESYATVFKNGKRVDAHAEAKNERGNCAKSKFSV